MKKILLALLVTTGAVSAQDWNKPYTAPVNPYLNGIQIQNGLPYQTVPQAYPHINPYWQQYYNSGAVNNGWFGDPWMGTPNQRSWSNPGTNWNPDGSWNPNGYQPNPNPYNIPPYVQPRF